MTLTPNRCRLVLITPDLEDVSELSDCVENALRGGDVASVIIPQRDLDDHAFQSVAETLVPIVQKANAAALIAGDTRVMGRSKADGVHVVGNAEDVYDAVEDFAPQKIVGGGNAKDRHAALSIGDTQPDYLFFGKIDGDIKPDAHPKNLALGQWWAEFVEIPCIVAGGSHIDCVEKVAETGCDFIALGKAVFAKPDEAALKVSEINAILDEKAPRFEDK
jgi:thiamine-phosphate pyrophosphorylase